MDNFYIVLPSNAHETNTPSKFSTTLKNPIQLENIHEWDAALVEMSFKNSIKTIHQDKAVVKYYKEYTQDSKANEPFVISSTTPFILQEHQVKWFLPSGTPLINWKTLELDKSFTLQAGDAKFYYENGVMNLTNTNSEYALHLVIPKVLATRMGFTLDAKKYFETNDAFEFTNIRPFQKVAAPLLPHILYDGKNNKNYLMFQPENVQDYLFNISYEIRIAKEIWTELILNPGTYKEAQDLEKEMTKSAVFNKYFKFTYDPRLNRFDVTSPENNPNLSLHFENGLNDVLGFSEKVLKSSETIQKGDLEVNLMRGISSLFVYCDFIDPIRVGNSIAPLMRTVSFHSLQYGEAVNRIYVEPHYLPINKTFIDAIEIMICDASGQTIPFVEGLTTVVIHFKRK